MIKRSKYWLGILTIIAGIYVYYLGDMIHTIDPKTDREAFIAAIWTHVGYASLLFVPLIAFAALGRKHAAKKMNGWERGVIGLFKLAVILKMITGLLAVWTRGSSLKVFDWFAIPSPVERMNGPHDFMETFHALLNYPLVIFFVLSCVAALKMAFDDKGIEEKAK